MDRVRKIVWTEKSLKSKYSLLRPEFMEEKKIVIFLSHCLSCLSMSYAEQQTRRHNEQMIQNKSDGPTESLVQYTFVQ